MQTRHAARSVQAVVGEPQEKEAGLDLHALRQRLLQRIGTERFERYFEGGRSVGVVDGEVRITAGSPFLARILEQRYVEDLRHAAADCGTSHLPVRVVVAEGSQPPTAARAGEPPRLSAPTPPAAPAAPARRRQGAARPARTSTWASLDAFVAAPENRLALEAAQRLGRGPEAGQPPIPVFFTGPCGSGKTHLLQGAAALRRTQRPGAQVLCVTAEAFANEYIAAVRSRNVEPMRRKYRALDLLCVDDVQALERKPATQLELQHTLDAIRQRGGCFAVASSEPVRAGGMLRDSLASRVTSGLTVRIGAPGQQALAQAARNAALRLGVTLDAAAADDLVRLGLGGTPPGSMREVEGLVVRLEAVQRLLCGGRGPVTLATVQRARQELSACARPGAAVRRPVKPEDVLDLVCRTLGVQREDVLATGRHARVVLARAVTARVIRSVTLLSYPEIARVLGRRNHSTVITACQRLEGQIAREERCVLMTGGSGPAREWSIGELCRSLVEEASRTAAA